MTSISEIIGETSDYDKKEKLEVKKPKSWCKSVSAFANGKGGKLIFGIADGTDEVIGIENPFEAGDKLSEIIKERIDPYPEFHLSFERIIIENETKYVMVVHVKPGSNTPYYYKGDGQQIVFQRIGSESVPATSITLKELALKGSNKSFDELPSEQSFENSSFSRLRSKFYNRTGKVFEEKEYESWGLIGQNGYLTNAGALLADDCTIKHSRLFCTRWNGLNKANGLMDALDDYEVTGNLLDLLEEGMSFCKRNYKKKWYKTANGRVELPDYAEESIFEGLVNSLIHRSYLEIGSEIHIDMYDNRLEITSPGGMYTGLPVQDRDLFSISSSRRNPILADIFNRLRLMDRRGSGFKKIVDNCELEPNYRKEHYPKFFSDESSFKLTLFNMNFNAQENQEVEVVDKIVISDNDYRVYKILTVNPTITSLELAKLSGFSERTVKTITKRLRDLKIVNRQGTKYPRWTIINHNVTN